MDPSRVAHRPARASLPRHVPSPGRGILVSVAVLVAGLFGARWLSDRLDERSSGSPAASIVLDEVSTTAPAPTVAPVVPAPNAAPAPAPAPAPASAPATTAVAPPPRTELTSIQTVPPLRDFIVNIDGRARSTDASGAIALSADDRDATVEVVGAMSYPALERAAFLGWADGRRDVMRSLDGIDGPVALIALRLESRVTIVADPLPPGATAVEFATAGGVVSLALDVPQWAVASRAVLSNGDLVVQNLDYTAQALQTADGQVPVAPQVFVPTPEALWQVDGTPTPSG